VGIWAVLAVLLLAGAPLQSSFAALYKWVDEQGNVTYSDRKPQDADAREVNVRAAPVTPEQARERLDALGGKADTQQKDRDFAKTAASEDQKEAEAFKKNCEMARQNMRVLENTSRIQGKDKDGNTYFLDPQEIEAKVEQSKKQVERYCK
jgi:hypothetical protein